MVSATILARQRATLAARMSATVIELPFDEGEAVRSGQVVARLADDAFRSALAAAEAGLVAAQADRERMERLLARDAATPRETEAVRARAAAAESEVEAAREALRYSSLRAPFSGRLSRRLVREGDVVSPGQALVEIEGAGGYELRASVDGGAAAAIAPGAALAVVVDGLAAGGATAGRAFTTLGAADDLGADDDADALLATVRAVTPAGDPGTHRFELVADLENVPGLRSGLYGRLLLPAAPGASGSAGQHLIPFAAAFARGGLTGVFVIADGVARLRWIAAGERQGDRLAVRAGLEAGERVVLDPAGLADGDPIAEER